MVEQDFESETGSELIVEYNDHADDHISTLSLGDQSYIMDLASQQQFRAEFREEEAMEDALELFKTAVEEGAKKSVDLFKQILGEVLRELNDENREKDRLQDEWLEAALQEELGRQNRGSGLNVSNHTLSMSLHSRGDMTTSIAGPPSIYNDAMSKSMMRQNSNIRMLDLDQKIHYEERKIVQKKIQKCERLIQEIVDEKGETEAKGTRKYKGYKKKLKEYRVALKKADHDEFLVSTHSKSGMYDWGTSETTESEKDDDSASSSSTFGGSNHSNRSSRDADEDLEWAKQVVAKLTLDSVESPPTEVTVDATPSGADVPKKEVQKKRGVPHKNASFNSNMATTRRLSGHELMIKSRLSLSRQPLAVTTEEDELEESATGIALVSDGSTHTEATPNDIPNRSPPVSLYSPSKRKSPSWKKTDVVKSVSVKHVVSQEKPTGPVAISPPLSNHKGSPSAEVSSSKLDMSKLYTLEDFQQGKVSGVDMADWEHFLRNEEFEKHFDMSKKDFDKLPKWKKLNAKRRLRTWA